MYRPPAFREDRIDVMHALIRNHPLATLVTAAGGLDANLVPFTIASDRGDKGVLRAHMAKGNDQLGMLRRGQEAMVIFQGPEHYITPSWYASKAEHGEVLPTWNYVVVLVWGTPQVIDDFEWLRVQTDELTKKQERTRAEPWNVTDAPETFVTSQLRGIVGLEIPISRIEGKWKVSQNRSEHDRRTVVSGLRAEGRSAAMAEIVAERLRQ
ncbi:FMN-binding negative transcriptional regulator [uncultured Bradyrhizobium sp.]|uniref:FMN-binding negative transcriptional regulator n=1 Tax=uncultured Bradyrhizobium sp. TaxID=199684 RepID=UPI0035CAEC6A